MTRSGSTDRGVSTWTRRRVGVDRRPKRRYAFMPVSVMPSMK